MNTHKLIKGTSKTGFLQYTLAISTDSLSNENLVKVVDYLIEHVHVIYDKFQHMQEEVMWPIEIRLGSDLALSEKNFWGLVLDNMPNSFDLIQKYINTLCELANTTEFNTLLQSNEYQFHGGFAFNQYWSWSIEGPLISTQELERAIELFAQWLSKNDLEFETSQDNYIGFIFERFAHLNDLGAAKLLALRLSDGQHINKGFDYLRHVLMGINGNKSCGLLKTVIEQLYGSKNSLNDNEATIYELCAVVYGSNEHCANEVMKYAKSIASTKLWATQQFQRKKINYLRQVGDIYWQQVTSQERYIDTSFHLFDTHTKQWIDYSERE